MTNSRGSIWKKCDFHVHTPFSALANNFGSDFDSYVQKLFKSAIEKKIAVIGITDYFTIEGYRKIKSDYLEKPAKLLELFSAEEINEIQKILILPNVEFRLNKIVQINKTKDGKDIKTESGRINFHVIFSNELPFKLIEEAFLHDLHFVYESDPGETDKKKKLKVDNLIQLGNRLKEEQTELIASPLQTGMTHAVVDDTEIMELLTSNKDFKDKYLIVVPSDEDLAQISWKGQDALTRKVILSKANCLFTSNLKTIEFGLAEKASSEEEFMKEFKSIKPSIWGSDAHGFDKLFEPDNKRYCWIKANNTFEGMRQILFEPKDRAYIGEIPELFTRIKGSRGSYINKLVINSLESYDGKKGIWFKEFEINMGFELIAIIGNKGKGKSAVADIVGLLGNAHVKDFSFLNADKFCQKGYAEHFKGTLKWYDGTENTKILNEKVDMTTAERVKYIPQSYLEKLCNDENSGFNEEINKVVFSRLDESDKLGKKSYMELQQFKTELINQQIDTLTLKLHSVNRYIDSLEQKANTDYKKSILNKKAVKDQELIAHNKEREAIAVIVNPENDQGLSIEQRQKAEKSKKISVLISQQEDAISQKNEYLRQQKIRLSELQGFRNELLVQQKQINSWKSIKTIIVDKYGLNIDDLIKVTINIAPLTKLIEETSKAVESTLDFLSPTSKKDDHQNEVSMLVKLQELSAQKSKIDIELEKPLKDYQVYLLRIKEWELKEKHIIGTASTEDTISYYENELNYIEAVLPQELLEQLILRKSLIIEIYNQKKEIQAIYNKMKGAISEVLKEYSAEQNITIESSFKIDKIFFTQFFDYVNRYGYFYSGGDEELRKLVSKYNFDDESHISEFIDEVCRIDIRFKDARKLDFFNYLSSLSYLTPEYDLKLGGKGLNQLSPGEKGGLLLVFYLVLDKDNKPLIIDQPEDNLDNQSVAEILVPYIKRAKKMRQIIMVTHNPNLAIVADAEQIIYMDINKENDYRVFHDTGGIEDSHINKHIVNILEGKMKAFDNRRVKYKNS